MLLTFSTLAAWAGGSVDVAQENKSSSVVLTSYLQIFEDPTRSLTLNDVQRAEIDAQFKTSGRLEKSINFSYSKSAYWQRLTLENSSDVAVNRVIEINYPLIEHLDFYWLRHAQQTQSVQTGYAMPFENRAYKSRIFAFPLAIAAHSQSVIYFRALSPNAIILPVNLWESRAFEQKERNEYAFQALYFGVLIAILLFCLALTLIVKEFDYVLCVSMTLFIALTLTAYRGLGAEFLWPHFPQLTQVGALFFGSLTLATKLAFMRRMLSMKWTMPRLDSLTQVFISLYLLIPALLLCCFDIAKFVVILFAFSAVLVLCVSVMGILQKQRNAYFICASFSLLAIGVLVNTSLVVALIPTNFFTVNSLQIGSAFELLVFTLLLTDRYRVIYQAKQQSEEILDDVSHKLVTEKEERREIELLKQTYFEHHFAIDQAAIFAETDDKGIITFVNKHFCRISGYSEAELIGSTHNLLKSGFHPPEFYSHLWKAIQSGRVWRDDICNRHKNGSLYWSNTVIVPILDFERRQGYPKKYITICFDVTDRKEAQQRQAMLTNQVNQMQKIESISRLTAGIAHDFNNILS
ncbi:MAG TPA: hypothetical protein DF614_07020, partial [Methylococcaceae bacterium]|nr:hypothetical protein [Methylococcaceae bacterium]